MFSFWKPSVLMVLGLQLAGGGAEQCARTHTNTHRRAHSKREERRRRRRRKKNDKSSWGHVKIIFKIVIHSLAYSSVVLWPPFITYTYIYIYIRIRVVFYILFFLFSRSSTRCGPSSLYFPIIKFYYYSNTIDSWLEKIKYKKGCDPDDDGRSWKPIYLLWFYIRFIFIYFFFVIR